MELPHLLRHDSEPNFRQQRMLRAYVDPPMVRKVVPSGCSMTMFTLDEPAIVTQNGRFLGAEIMMVFRGLSIGI